MTVPLDIAVAIGGKGYFVKKRKKKIQSASKGR
nr:MAG TPA: hypothetical protein [Caudoviricetes sp.]